MSTENKKLTPMFNKKQDAHWLLKYSYEQGKLHDLEDVAVSLAYDKETDDDVSEMNYLIFQAKLIKKTALLKLCLMIPEYILSLILLSSEGRAHRFKLNSVYYRFLFNKLTLNQFKNELQVLLNRGIIY